MRRDEEGDLMAILRVLVGFYNHKYGYPYPTYIIWYTLVHFFFLLQFRLPGCLLMSFLLFKTSQLGAKSNKNLSSVLLVSFTYVRCLWSDCVHAWVRFRQICEPGSLVESQTWRTIVWTVQWGVVTLIKWTILKSHSLLYSIDTDCNDWYHFVYSTVSLEVST